jgi:hypothetical protein
MFLKQSNNLSLLRYAMLMVLNMMSKDMNALVILPPNLSIHL